MRRMIFAAALSVLAAAASVALAKTETSRTETFKTETYSGEAFKKGQLVYREKHQFTVGGDGKVISSKTEYLNPDGKPIALLENRFAESLNCPAHDFQDFRNGQKHGVRYVDGKPVMYNQEKDKPEETKSLSEKEQKGRMVVGGQGLHYYLREHFSELNKKDIPILFLIPGRLEGYKFELNFLRDTNGVLDYEIEIDNFFLKLFAPKLDMVYERSSKRLLNYKGLSNLLDDKGKNQSVEIKYAY
jgi:hypothetical protein